MIDRQLAWSSGRPAPVVGQPPRPTDGVRMISSGNGDAASRLGHPRVLAMNGSEVAGLIRTRLDELSPNDRRIARQLLDHWVEAPFETAESLAGKAGVSKAAVVRFATRVGFAGFSELHDAL